MTVSFRHRIIQPFGWAIQVPVARGSWKSAYLVPFIGYCDHCGERPSNDKAFRQVAGPRVPDWLR